MPSSPDTQLISAQIRAEVARRGLRRQDLATRTGLSPRIITNVVSGNDCSPRPRALIEAALDCAFWTDTHTFNVRRKLRGVFGVDLYTLNRRQLDPYARKFLPPGDIRAQHLARRELLLRLYRVTEESPAAPPTNHPSTDTPCP